MTAHQFILFLPAALLVAASPGAGNFLAFNHGLRWGLKQAVIALLGRCAAFAVLLAAVAIGLGALLAASAMAFSLLKWAGVAYLLYLAYRLWRADPAPHATETPAVTSSALQLVRREFMVAITNPKAMLLFTAFLPQFARGGGAAPFDLMQLGAAYMLIEFMTASGYALVGSRIKILHLGRAGSRWVNRLSASCMATAAGWLAAIRHPAT